MKFTSIIKNTRFSATTEYNVYFFYNKKNINACRDQIFKATMNNTVLYAVEMITLGRHGTEYQRKRKEKSLGIYQDQIEEAKGGSEDQGMNRTRTKDNLGRNQTQKGKICWTSDQDRYGQNDQKSLGDKRKDNRLLNCGRTGLK